MYCIGILLNIFFAYVTFIEPSETLCKHPLNKQGRKIHKSKTKIDLINITHLQEIFSEIHDEQDASIANKLFENVYQIMESFLM